jgi:hypothetical protein
MRARARWMGSAAIVGIVGGPLGLVAVAAPPAWADSASPVVSYSNWYWSGKDGATATTPLGNGPFAAPDEASAIPAGDLGVAYTNDVDKVAALDFGLQSIPEGATVSKFLVVMPLDATASNLAAADGPKITACPAIAPFEPAEGPTELSKAPAQAANVCVDGTYNATAKTYTFDIASAADDWSAGAPSNGIVIRPKLGESTQFNYAFQGRNAIKVIAEYSSAATPVGPPAAAPPVDAGTAVAPPPSSFTTGTTPLAPAAPVSGPVTAPAPQVMPPAAPVQVPAAPAAAVVAVDALRPAGGFWLALLGLAALLVLVGLVLGDPMDPVVVDARRRRFADVVRARAAARAAAQTARPATSPRPRHA